MGYGQPQQAPVVVGQPASTNVAIIQQGGPVRPSNYLALAIVTTICCNLVFGKCICWLHLCQKQVWSNQ
jgi:hypothetical protein